MDQDSNLQACNAIDYLPPFLIRVFYEKSCFSFISHATVSNYCKITQLHKLLYRKLRTHSKIVQLLQIYKLN